MYIKEVLEMFNLELGQVYRVQDNFMLDRYLVYKGTIRLVYKNKLIYIFQEYDEEGEIDFEEERMRQLTFTPY